MWQVTDFVGEPHICLNSNTIQTIGSPISIDQWKSSSEDYMYVVDRLFS
jgi:hypothetical protein